MCLKLLWKFLIPTQFPHKLVRNNQKNIIFQICGWEAGVKHEALLSFNVVTQLTFHQWEVHIPFLVLEEKHRLKTQLCQSVVFRSRLCMLASSQQSALLQSLLDSFSKCSSWTKKSTRCNNCDDNNVFMQDPWVPRLDWWVWNQVFSSAFSSSWSKLMQKQAAPSSQKQKSKVALHRHGFFFCVWLWQLRSAHVTLLVETGI